jgi:tripartite-type tricarboxylate transporter receptor subunit TctC
VGRTKSRRSGIGGLILVALTVFVPFSIRADDYPTRPVHLLITSPAGALVDVIGRLYAEHLSEKLGQPVVVDNRPGAMTQLATGVLVHADPDGYTLMLGPSELVMLPFLKKDYPFNPTRDITPVSLVTTSWTLFAIYPGLPVQTLPEFIDYAKARPGKPRYGSGGVGGALHIAVELLKLKTGIDMIHVPYRGGEQEATDAMAGQIEMASMGLASGRVAAGGKLRLLAQTGPVRHPLYPDVPTTAEYGLPEVRMDTWFSLVAPPKTPAAIVERLDRATAAIEQEQGFRDGLARIGCALAYKSHLDFAAFIADEVTKWQKLIPVLGIPQIE